MEVSQNFFFFSHSAPDGNDDRSSDFEAELATVREDLVDSLNAWVVKAVGSPMVRRYVGKEHQGPAVVFFRRQVPVLYDGQGKKSRLSRRDFLTYDRFKFSFKYVMEHVIRTPRRCRNFFRQLGKFKSPVGLAELV